MTHNDTIAAYVTTLTNEDSGAVHTCDKGSLVWVPNDKDQVRATILSMRESGMTMRAIAKALGLKSASTVHWHMKTADEKREIRKARAS